MTFGERVMLLRGQHDMKRVDLARAIDMKPQTLAHYEKDDREPGTDTLIKIANVFGVSVDYLIGNEVEEIRPVQWELIRATASLPDEKILALVNLISE